MEQRVQPQVVEDAQYSIKYDQLADRAVYPVDVDLD
jgi:hypothetical protein